MDEETPPSSFFAEPSWEPVCVIGAHGDGKLNAQIAVSVFGASIVPDRPRVLVVLWNGNYTADLVRRSGTFAITVMSESQLSLLGPLGLRTGRDDDKLAGLDYQTTTSGDPWFPGGAGLLVCRVIQSVDLGDATLFVCAVNEEHRTEGVQPITWGEAQELVDEEFLRAYREKFAADGEDARATMRWIT